MVTDPQTPAPTPVATDEEVRRFSHLEYEDFRRLAVDPTLGPNERIGFPDRYRAGFEDAIFDDVVSKLPPLRKRGMRVLEIGPGCGPLPRLLLDLCAKAGHRLLWVDAPEMLDQLPDAANVTKLPGPYPEAAEPAQLAAACDVVLAYSVFHHVFAERGGWSFLDAVLGHLAPGGAALIGDIPNLSKRRRFLASASGRAFHAAVTGDDSPPDVNFNTVEPGAIDDAVLYGLVLRARAAGFNAYVVPQPAGLPLANRREDLLVLAP